MSETATIAHNNLLHNQVLHDQVVLLTVVSEDSPRVAAGRRFEVEAHGEGFFRINLHFGFMLKYFKPLNRVIELGTQVEM